MERLSAVKGGTSPCDDAFSGTARPSPRPVVVARLRPQDGPCPPGLRSIKGAPRIAGLVCAARSGMAERAQG